MCEKKRPNASRPRRRAQRGWETWSWFSTLAIKARENRWSAPPSERLARERVGGDAGIDELREKEHKRREEIGDLYSELGKLQKTVLL